MREKYILNVVERYKPIFNAMFLIFVGVSLVFIVTLLLFFNSHSIFGLSDEDRFYLDIAYVEASKALETGDVPVGAVIVHNGKIIAKAHNRVEVDFDHTAHAEMIVINDALNILNITDFSGVEYDDLTLYTTLEPCAMCEGFIISTNVPKVVAGKRKGLLEVYYDNFFKHLLYRFRLRSGLDEQKQMDLFYEAYVRRGV